jgi:hypothetical protein
MKFIGFAICVAVIVAIAAFLSGCSSFGPATVSFESQQYGKFSYQLPEMPREWKVYKDK